MKKGRDINLKWLCAFMNFLKKQLEGPIHLLHLRRIPIKTLTEIFHLAGA